MKNILIISKREIARLRSRFRGRARIAVLSLIAISLAISYVVYQQDFVLSQDFYAVGVSPGSPAPADERFHVIPIDRSPEETGGTSFSNRASNWASLIPILGVSPYKLSPN